MASARSSRQELQKQSQPGKIAVGKTTQNQNLQSEYLNSLMRQIIKNEIEKYDRKDHEYLHQTYNFINGEGKNMSIKELLQAHYEYDLEPDQKDGKYYTELPHLLILLGIGIECPTAPGNRTNEQYMFLVEYYKAIVNVYKNTTKNPNQDNLYDFIMSYFASVCSPSS